MLIRVATDPASDPAVAAHVATCAACTAAVAKLAVIRDALRRSRSAPNDRCLDEMAVARMVDSRATPEELAHAAHCSTCRARVADVVAAASAGPVATEIRRLESGTPATWRRRTLAVGAVAAAVILALSFGSRARRDAGRDSDTYRDPSALDGAPTAVFPVDAVVTEPVELRWRSTPKATQYRVTVFDVEGGVVWSGEAADTSAVVADTARFMEGAPYWWRVEAQVGFARWLQSEVTPFSIGAGRR